MAVGAVIFDLYGTLVDETPQAEFRKMQERLADILGVEREGFTRHWNETSGERMTGSWKTNVAGIVSRLGGELGAAKLAEALRYRDEYSRVVLTPRPDAEDTILEL